MGLHVRGRRGGRLPSRLTVAFLGTVQGLDGGVYPLLPPPRCIRAAGVTDSFTPAPRRDTRHKDITLCAAYT
jgi:hypothetical protein